MIYHGYQINPKSDLSKEIAQVLRSYIERNGLPEQIVLEYSYRLKEVELPEGMNVVTRAISIPPNILLIGAENENQIRLDQPETSFQVPVDR